MIRLSSAIWLLLFVLTGCKSAGHGVPPGTGETTVLDNVTLIDGTGAPAREKMALVLQADTISAILPHGSDSLPANARRLDMEGKVVMPLLVNAHGHVGLLKGNGIAAAHYTRENILRHLERYEAYGVGTVLSLGSDREIIFDLRNASRRGELPGARLLTAGQGFGVPGGAPPVEAGFDKVFRPRTAEEAVQNVRQLAPLAPDFIKVWVDDFGGQLPKMQPEIYGAVIQEAHRQGLRVAAHVFYLEDARGLVAAGVDVLAHSIRDREIDEALLREMKAKNVVYIPTLSLDEYNFIYLRQPEWMNGPFFQNALEPGVLEMLRSEAYLEKLKNDPSLRKKMDGFKTALLNLKKIHAAGIKVAMGTDSGAQPVRVQGFSEHLELELMTEAGLTPLEALTAATGSGAELLKIDAEYGTLQPGKKAHFLVLNGDPSRDIKQTRNVSSVWKNGQPTEFLSPPQGRGQDTFQSP